MNAGTDFVYDLRAVGSVVERPGPSLPHRQATADVAPYTGKITI